jgi:hypothetical protein
LGLPLLNDRVALLLASFIFDLSKGFSQHTQNFTHIRLVQRWAYHFKWLSCQVQVQQIVVTEVHQLAQGLGLNQSQTRLKALEKPLNEQIIFKQTPATTPLELAQSALANQLIRAC